jgi:integrase
MRRHQKGSLQIRKHGGIRKYVAFYYGADGKRVCVTIGQVSKMSKGQAEAKLAELVASVNARDERDPTLAEFLAAEYLPFKRRAWKSSTASTTEQRLRTHLQEDLGKLKISELRRGMMAEYLEGKAARGLSHSLVAHLRWDFKAVLDLAVADGIVKTNQAKDLFVPKVKGVVSTKTATPQQVMAALSALDVRDRLMVRLALFVGLRPGEICALGRGTGRAAGLPRRGGYGKEPDPAHGGLAGVDGAGV